MVSLEATECVAGSGQSRCAVRKPPLDGSSEGRPYCVASVRRVWSCDSQPWSGSHSGACPPTRCEQHDLFAPGRGGGKQILVVEAGTHHHVGIEQRAEPSQRALVTVLPGVRQLGNQRSPRLDEGTRVEVVEQPVRSAAFRCAEAGHPDRGLSHAGH